MCAHAPSKEVCWQNVIPITIQSPPTHNQGPFTWLSLSINPLTQAEVITRIYPSDLDFISMATRTSLPNNKPKKS